MKQTILVAVTVLALLSFKTIDPATWTVDKNHSKLGFSVSHLMVSDIEGSFKTFDAKISTTKDDFTDATVVMTADVSSINTDNTQRDNHLKSADFFDAAKYPTITFTSTSFKKVSDKNYKVTGILVMHGVSKTVELNAVANIGTNPMSHKTISGFKITGKINRSDFNLGASIPSAMVGNEVDVTANAEFAKN